MLYLYTCTYMCTYFTCMYVRTRVRTYNVTGMSQLSDWRRAHMCTRVFWEDTRQPVHVYVQCTYQSYHNFLIGKGHVTGTYVQQHRQATMVHVYHVSWNLVRTRVPWYYGTYTCTMVPLVATIHVYGYTSPGRSSRGAGLYFYDLQNITL
jgi:hypothetical protein